MLLSWKHEGQNVTKKEKYLAVFFRSANLRWNNEKHNFFLSLELSELTSVMAEVTWQ